jgi:hypothetical protein
VFRREAIHKLGQQLGVDLSEKLSVHVGW